MDLNFDANAETMLHRLFHRIQEIKITFAKEINANTVAMEFRAAKRKATNLQ